MKPFISLPKKMIFLLLGVLLALSASMSILWLQKTNQDFVLKQQEIKQQNQSQYLLLNQMFRNRIEAWVEIFVRLHENQPEQINALAETLQSRYEYLQLNWQIEDMWLYDSSQSKVFSTRTSAPDYVKNITKDVFNTQRSEAITYCSETCIQVISVPILERNSDMSVLTLSMGLLDTFAFLNRSTDATLALVHMAGEPKMQNAKSLFIRGPLARRQYELIAPLIASLPESMSLDRLLLEGAHVNLDDADYFVALIPMSTVNSERDFVLAAHNITPVMKAHKDYQKSIFVTATVVFVSAILLLYLLTNSVRKRLILLAARLPLLSQRQYKSFKTQSQTNSHYFKDELDSLNDSANELAIQLEQLDEEVQAKTSELEKIAMFDQLTNLPNRNMLLFDLERSIANLQRKPGFVVLLLFDLDDFKKVNDSYGHTVGDELLIEAAIRFQSVVRETDMAYRLGGDEFAILLAHLDEIDGAIKVADKLLDRFRAPINVGATRFYVSTSIGLSITISHDTEVAEVIRHADIAMYQAKAAGGNSYKIYDESMSKLAMDKVALEDEARGALIDDHFSFALQPQIELSTGKLIGFEALLRWDHPERGEVSPGYFIPMLENTEFMLSLGYWCIENAFSQLLAFRDKGYPDLKIAINMAGIQFLDPDLIVYLQEKIHETGLNPNLFELELTERTLVSDIERTTQIMRTLIHKGFLISIDDFGTGYSSLSYLKKMPAQYIKIDRAFIDGMLKSNADRQIVASTVAMVQNLDMKVIAEGIEEPEQIEILKAFGCDMAQGYHIAKPIPQSRLFADLENYCKDGVWCYGNAQVGT
ncbi:MAG: hypothetical protein Alis3KO_38560 [Aliiglaciecola sp.]